MELRNVVLGNWNWDLTWYDISTFNASTHIMFYFYSKKLFSPIWYSSLHLTHSSPHTTQPPLYHRTGWMHVINKPIIFICRIYTSLLCVTQNHHHHLKYFLSHHIIFVIFLRRVNVQYTHFVVQNKNKRIQSFKKVKKWHRVISFYLKEKGK